MNPANPLTQDDLRNTASLNFGLPGNLSAKTSFLQESQRGTSLGENDSLGGRVELSSLKWKDFNFSVSGECKFTNVVEAGSNTMVPQTAPGNGIFSQTYTYTYTMEGKPLDHLTLSGKGMYSNDPPGPAKANVTETYKTDPLKWLTSNGSYSLDFQQEQALGSESPDEVHTASANVEATPLSWLKLSTQPSMRLDILADYGQMVSENLHQNYRVALTPSFGSLSGDYTLDQYWTWDASTAGFPENFNQQTETIDLAAKKPLGKVTEELDGKDEVAQSCPSTCF